MEGLPAPAAPAVASASTAAASQLFLRALVGGPHGCHLRRIGAGQGDETGLEVGAAHAGAREALADPFPGRVARLPVGDATLARHLGELGLERLDVAARAHVRDRVIADVLAVARLGRLEGTRARLERARDDLGAALDRRGDALR